MFRHAVTQLTLGLCLWLGFVTPDAAVADDAALLIAPQELQAGGSSSLTVTTFDAGTRAPIDRTVVVTLHNGDATVATLHDGSTGASGHLRVAFDVPRVDSGSYRLEARIGGVEDTLVVNTTVSGAPAILIETDKPIYKPSQTIQGRVLLVDNALRPVQGQVELTIHDGKGIRIDRKQLSANEYGAAEFSLDLASEVNFGVWKLRAVSEGVETVRDVLVEEYTLPRFDLTVDVARAWTLVDEEVAGTVTARYFFGQDVQGRAVLSARRWVGTWEDYARIEGDIEDGSMAFTLPPVGFVTGSPEHAGQGLIAIDVEATDSTGHTQTASAVLTVPQSSLVLGLIPRDRTMKPGIPFTVLLTARSPEGEPLDTTASVSATYFATWGDHVSSDERRVTVAGGRSEIVFTPPENAAYVELSANASRDGRDASTHTRLDGSFSSGNSFLSLARVDGEGSASIGAELRFETTSTHAGTVYYEVYASGRTVLSDASESGNFQIAVTPSMVPKAKVLAYKINPDNEVSADSLEFEVDLASSIEVTASFDRDDAGPGQPVTLTFDTGTGARALLGVSIVDQSVLALGRSRLHLGDVFDELERRFLEPKAEVHEGEPGRPGGPIGGPGGFVGDWFGPPSVIGPLDVVHGIGLEIAASENIGISAGHSLWDVAAEFDGPFPAPPGAAPRRDDEGNSASPEAVRVRQYFPETWVWRPRLITDASGRAQLELTTPDTITSWALNVVSSSTEGIGFGSTALTVFQDFFVEPSLPFSVTRGEEFPVKVDVFNYLDEDQDVALSFGESSWFELLGDGDLQISVPPNSATSVEFPIRPTELGTHRIELTAVGSRLSDAVLRDLTVVPEGVPAEEVTNGVIEAGSAQTVDVSFPDDIIPGSARAFLNVTPSPVAQTMQGVSDLLGMPYGCGEQNMIFLAPDIEILKYLRETGELAPEIRATAEYYVNVGYQRELTFQTADGGFAAFGGEEGSLWLTAFVLSTFAGAREVRDIDEAVLESAAAMLVSRQNEDGSFRTDDFLIHKEMDGGLENVYSMAAYVTNALADYASGGAPTDAVRSALTRAAEYLRDTRGRVERDAYSLAIAAGSLQKVDGFEAAAEGVIDQLLELAIREGIGLHWEPYPVETTGYAAMALLAANGGVGRPEAPAALDWLSAQRNSLGGYGGSTQDTVVAIRALFTAARNVRRDLDVRLTVSGGDATIWTLEVNESNFDLLHTTPLPLESSDGYQFRLETEGSGSLGYQVVKRFHVPEGSLPPPKDMLIDVEYRTDGIEVDDVLDVAVRLLYTGSKEATGMVIADIGVPTGFDVLRNSTDALIEAGTVSRIEMAGRKVIFYIDSLRRNSALEFTFQMRAVYPVRAAGPVSRVYEYYDNQVEAYDSRGAVVITPRSQEMEFVRGDPNADGAVNLADAVGVLQFLFGGAHEPSVVCEDAADTNDDGELNITDTVYLLEYLFLRGPEPPAPYPDPGPDATDDELRCVGG